EGEGYTYSYDMLGEAARTDADARAYTLAYARAISAIAPRCTSADVRENPGISVKLSALSPRYEFAQAGRVARELVPRAKALAQFAAAANMGFNIDAEEQDRLDLSLDVIEAVIAEPALAGWEGFGVVVQAYGPRAVHIVEWLAALARRHDRRIMLRLVKGAYWDAEIKRAQVLGLEGFPVFTRKLSTDVSYLACARVLLDHADRIYSQFATHNAHTVAAVRRMAEEAASVTPRGLGPAYEFQKLHGMGDALYAEAMKAAGMRCRIYAPVGAHRDLLAYLVRRLLENGANSSFVNQIVDESISPEEIARDPLAEAEALVAPGGGGAAHPRILRAPALWGPSRRNAKGWDLTDPLVTDALADARENWRSHHWQAAPMLAAGEGSGTEEPVTNPADPGETVGTVRMADPAAVEAALAAAGEGFADWSARDAAARAGALRRAADLYEAHAPELFALCAREAGKTLPDAVAELREAVDFLRFYAAEAERLAAAGGGDQPGAARGAVVCISPLNFPPGLSTAQFADGLAAGNAV
ncbi:MAG: proline dehydrogenase family protein, partial [Pseudomonadota bacterium]